jgi:hypothetical protein
MNRIMLAVLMGMSLAAGLALAEGDVFNFSDGSKEDPMTQLHGQGGRD